METRKLIEKWTVSKGRDTAGYNICSLWENGDKIASCNGGGYDMQGTVIAEFLCSNFQDRLLRLVADKCKVEKRNEFYGNITPFYGMTFVYATDKKSEHVHLDGACGLSSIENIARAIGVTFDRTKINSNEDIIYVFVEVTKK